MRFLIKKTPDGFLKSVNDEISSILSRNMEGLFPRMFKSIQIKKQNKL